MFVTKKGKVYSFNPKLDILSMNNVCVKKYNSKIGKIAISIPDKVKVAINGGILNIDGPKGKKSLNIDTDIFDLDIKEGKEIQIKPKK